MRALVSTSAKLKSKIGEEDSWELTRESNDEEDQYEDKSSSVYQCKAEEKIGEEDSWELTRESDDEKDQYEDEGSSFYQHKAKEQDRGRR